MTVEHPSTLVRSALNGLRQAVAAKDSDTAATCLNLIDQVDGDFAGRLVVELGVAGFANLRERVSGQ